MRRPDNPKGRGKGAGDGKRHAADLTATRPAHGSDKRAKRALPTAEESNHHEDEEEKEEALTMEDVLALGGTAEDFQMLHGLHDAELDELEVPFPAAGGAGSLGADELMAFVSGLGLATATASATPTKTAQKKAKKKAAAEGAAAAEMAASAASAPASASGPASKKRTGAATGADEGPPGEKLTKKEKAKRRKERREQERQAGITTAAEEVQGSGAEEEEEEMGEHEEEYEERAGEMAAPSGRATGPAVLLAQQKDRTRSLVDLEQNWHQAMDALATKHPRLAGDPAAAAAPEFLAHGESLASFTEYARILLEREVESFTERK